MIISHFIGTILINKDGIITLELASFFATSLPTTNLFFNLNDS